MKNNLEYRGVIRLCLFYICFLVPPPYFAHFPHGHCFNSFSKLDTQQQYHISGTVTDSYGPMPGVHVLIKGTNNGTFTDANGEYSLLVNNRDFLIFSYLGYHTRDLPVLGRTNLDVEMQSEVTELQEVEVNAGYYTVKEKERTGSISRVTAKEIELQPIVSPLEALQGRMAGVEVVPNGNLPGMASTIRIRGTNSLRSEGNLPLYLVDGVPVNAAPVESNSLLGATGIDPLNTIDLNSIESIEVLKDADATAIYGSRGANGIILITTKKGTGRKTTMAARAYSGMSVVPNRLELLNTQQYIQIRKKAFENDGVEPNLSNAYDLLLWDQIRYTDWQEFYFGGTATITNVDVSVMGGNENTSFRVGGSYQKQGTVYKGDHDYNKVTASVNLNHTAKNKKLSMDLSVNYGADTNNLLAGGVNLTSFAFFLPPNAPAIFNGDGSLNWDEWEEIGWNNPFEGYYNYSRTQANNLVSNMGLRYELFKGLNFRTNLGYTHYQSTESIKKPKRSYSPSTRESIGHSSAYLQSIRKSWIIEPQFNYTLQWGKVNINGIVGSTLQQSTGAMMGIQGEGYASESLIGNLNAASDLLYPTSQNSVYRYSALYGRLGLDWEKRFFLNLTGRRDGSSRFGPNKQFANFGAIGAAWLFSEEPFMKDFLSFLSFGKFRGSYGTAGNDQIGDYGYLDAYEATPGPGGLYPTQLANPDYSWEINKKLEAAMELGFYDDRIHLWLSWYRNRSSNQLVGYILPDMTGFSSVQANLPATVQNTGWELDLATQIFRTGQLKWKATLNLSLPRNQLVSYPDIEQSPYANTYRVGHPLNISLLYEYNGIDPETGLYSISDINGDGRYSYEDRVVVQDWGRELFGGINNTLQYKGLSLQFLWQYVKQEGKVSLFRAGDLSTQLASVMDALEGKGNYQQISQSSAAGMAYTYALNTSLPIQDASFLRLKTLSLTYDLPSKVLGNIGLDACRLFVNGYNLITISPYRGMDPEMPLGGTAFSGLRTISCGIQLNF